MKDEKREEKAEHWEYRSREREFEKKLDRGFLIALIGSFVVVVGMILLNGILKQGLKNFLVFFNEDADIVFENLRTETSFLGNAVWTLTTILASFMVLHYSAIGVNTYGIQNRKIISYTCGSYYIPSIVSFNIFIVFGMTYAYYTNFYAMFYILAVYSMMLQLLLIIGSIAITSQRVCFSVILKIEQMQYERLCKSICVSQSANLGEGQSKEIIEKNLLIYHVDLILKGQATLTEKLEIIQEIFKMPFYVTNTSSCFHATYYYLYQNMKHLITYTGENIDERQQLYASFYQSANNIFEIYKECPQESAIKNNIFLYLSALFHAVIPEKRLEERWEFLFCIIQILGFRQNSQDEDVNLLKETLIVALLMSAYDLWRKGLIDFSREDEALNMEQFVQFIFFRDAKISAQGLRRDLNKIKKDLQEIVFSWIDDAGFLRLD